MNEEHGKPDWERIAHLFKLGIAASLLALIGGDMPTCDGGKCNGNTIKVGQCPDRSFHQLQLRINMSVLLKKY
jgi:hypothetical protein